MTHSKDALFIAMVDFNLPTIEVGLQKLFGSQLVESRTTGRPFADNSAAPL
jgi:hypothetical protein